ncbi:MAG: hypothetical protein Ct9H300mP4_12060 [Gammaproteobacteria bacterium]|nr:MAG: hypothetical protein Ct9H300mP4_12060 [Gammaproteobacteria bacterium]
MIIFVFVFLIQGCSNSQDEFANQEERLNALTLITEIAKDFYFMQTSDDKYFAWVNRINEQAYSDAGIRKSRMKILIGPQNIRLNIRV